MIDRPDLTPCTYPGCTFTREVPPYPEQPVCEYHEMPYVDRINNAKSLDELRNAMGEYQRVTGLDPAEWVSRDFVEDLEDLEDMLWGPL